MTLKDRLRLADTLLVRFNKGETADWWKPNNYRRPTHFVKKTLGLTWRQMIDAGLIVPIQDTRKE